MFLPKWTSRLLPCALLVAVLPAQDRNADKDIHNPFGKSAAAVEAGQAQFGSGCAVCHGPKGQGGRGSRLAGVERVQKMRDADMFRIIQNGVSGTQMPPCALSEESIWQIISFIRSLNSSAVDQNVEGDVSAGEALFFGLGECSVCHMIRGQGGLIGPDLSNIGARRPLDAIRQSIQEPSALIEPGFAHVTVVTRSGQRLSGVARNESNYSILIQDSTGQIHSFPKRDLRELIHHADSLMPKRAFSAMELQNLLAFLSRQSLASPEDRIRIEHGKEVEP